MASGRRPAGAATLAHRARRKLLMLLHAPQRASAGSDCTASERFEQWIGRFKELLRLICNYFRRPIIGLAFFAMLIAARFQGRPRWRPKPECHVRKFFSPYTADFAAAPIIRKRDDQAKNILFCLRESEG